jgi:hypothetical protein
MLALLRASISDEEMVAIFRMLVEKAVAKDVSAAKLVLSYKLGKPAPAPNPDQIDRDEWEHFQRDAINLDEVQQVLGSLPSKVGNDIARTALPIVTQAQKEALASRLVKNLPAAHKPAKESGVAIEQPREAAPIPNGFSAPCNDAVGAQSTIHAQPSTTNEAPPIPNGESDNASRALQESREQPEGSRIDPSNHDSRSTLRNQRSTRQPERSPTPSKHSSKKLRKKVAANSGHTRNDATKPSPLSNGKKRPNEERGSQKPRPASNAINMGPKNK